MMIGVAAGPLAAAEQADDRGLAATIRYTEYGIPHIVAKDYAGLGFGQGYAMAKDNLCTIADGMVVLSAQAARYHGADAPPRDPLATGARTNLASDLYFQSINDSGVVERLLAKLAPLGPRPEVRAMARGFAAGYNRYLTTATIIDPACRGAAWLRPMTELDVHRRSYAHGLVFGQAGAAEAIVAAQPPSSPAQAGIAGAAEPFIARNSGAAEPFIARNSGVGSNAIAAGGAATTTGRGLSLANPHLPWRGGLRFWQSHLTIPGRYNVAGATVMGVPFQWIGHNDTMAWSGTAADQAHTATLFELTLKPGEPTTYLVDGRPEPMQRREVTVVARAADGTTNPVTRTQWWTRYGPITIRYESLDLPWTTTTAYAVADANAQNMRMANTMFAVNHARNTDEVLAGIKQTQGLPWMNVLATDSNGHTLFTDIQVVPHVTDAHAARCNTPLGQQTFPARGLAVLDGSRSGCAWGQDADALQAGTFGPASLPQLADAGYVAHSNDSPWLVNPQHEINDFPRILGTRDTERNPRTRAGFTAIADQLGRGRFDRLAMQELMLSNRVYMAEVIGDDLVQQCRSWGAQLADACDVLARWDRRADADSRGSLLFDRFWNRVAPSASLWIVPFDPEDPIRTPRGLNPDNPAPRVALAAAVAELQAAGVPLDAALGAHQYVERNGVRIPIGGGAHRIGVYNTIHGIWDGHAYSQIWHGSSYLHVVAFTGGRCPDAVTLLTYSQSSDPTSPHNRDQTELFSQKRWVTERFCEQDIMTSPALRTVHLRAGNI